MDTTEKRTPYYGRRGLRDGSVTVDKLAEDVKQAIENAAEAQKIDSVTATVDNNTGTPSAEVSLVDGAMTFAFHNIKGDTGDTGATGATGATGPQGASAVFDPDTGNILATLHNKIGDDDSNAMTQKAVTDMLIYDGSTINLSSYDVKNIYINASAKWATSNNFNSIFVPVTPGDTLHVKAGGSSFIFAFLTSNSYTSGNDVSTFAGGATGRTSYTHDTEHLITVPSGAAYLYITRMTGAGTDMLPAYIKKTYTMKDEVAEARTYEGAIGVSTTRAMTQKAVTDEMLSNIMSVNLTRLAELSSLYINGSGKWASSSSMACKLLPVTPGEMYRIVANSNSYTVYAFLLSTDTHTASDDAAFSSGARVVVAADNEAVVTIPANTEWLYINTKASNVDATPTVTLIESVKGKVSRIGDDTTVDKRLSTTGYETIDYVIDANGLWDKQTTSGTKYSLVPITPGKVYKILPMVGKSMTYSLLTDNEGIANGATPHYATGYSTRVQQSGVITIQVPEDAHYFAFMSVYQNESRTPQYIAREDTLKEAVTDPIKTLRARLQNVGINAGKYVYGDYPTRKSCAKLYERPMDGNVTFVFSADSNSGNFGVAGYDNDKQYLHAIGVAFSKDTPVEVEIPADFIYFKPYLNPNPDGAPLTVDMTMEGHFADDCEHYNAPLYDADANGNYMIPITVNVDMPDPTEQDEATAVVAHTTNIQQDHGILALPSTYTPDGEPTRLIIFCHGAGKKIKRGATGFPSGEYGVDPDYWLSEGYAVMDMDGYPGDEPSQESPSGDPPQHWCSPAGYLCYLAGYRHVVNNYNICKDGVFLGGRSMGGGMALMILSYKEIPVKACTPFACMHPNFPALFKNRTTAQKEFIAQSCGIYNPDSVAWPDKGVQITGDNVLSLIMLEEVDAANNQKRYIGNFGRLMQCSPLYRLCVNNPSAEEYMAADIQNANRTACTALFGNLACKTDVPVKFFGAYDDTTAGPYWVNLWAKMLRNGGCLVEQRMFPTGGHPFDLASDNLVSSYTNSKGVTLTDVPIAYIEALQFWRRYE